MDRLERARVQAAVRSRLFGHGEDPVRVGSYEIRGRLGSGAMGVVYEAWDPRLRRTVALKMLRADREDKQREQRLMREAQALAQLRHPDVVAVHDAGTDDGQVYVVMERIVGESLLTWTRRMQPQVPELLDVLTQVGRGLEAAHQLGLVHRDVKPENVLVSEDGIPHLLDFGLVRRTDAKLATTMRRRTSGALSAAITHAGTVLGTPYYMAPEQLAGETVDQRADQYSFAVTCHHALYGHLPFAADNLGKLLEAIAKGSRRQPADVGEPAAVRSALARALRRDPEQRFPSMAEFLKELAARDGSRFSRPTLAVVALVCLVGVSGVVVGLLADGC